MQDRDRFDKFTERARQVLNLAQEEARRFNHNYIGTEHLLLALVREGDGIAAKVLANLGVSLDDARQRVERIIGHGDRIVLGEVGLTPRAKKVIELAVDEARRMGHHYIGTEHLLLGLVREGEGIAAQVLESLDVNLERVRTQTIQVLDARSALATQAPHRPPHEATIAGQFMWARGTSGGLTERARQVLSLAYEEAQRFNHNYIGPEHLLLGLVKVGDGLGAQVLRRLGVGLENVRDAVEQVIGRDDRTVVGEVGLTPRARNVIDLAAEEAQQLGHRYVGTEHLLLGLVREGEGIAAHVLAQLGVNIEQVRAQTLEVRGASAAPAATTPQEPPHEARLLGIHVHTWTPAAEPSHEARDTVAMDRDSFQKFTFRARKVLSLAQEEAQRFNHNYIGTEHLLLGLIREEDGLGAQVLQRLGVELAKARNRVEFIIGRGDRIVLGEIGLTPRAKKVIELAMDESRRLNHPYIGTEHLLLGLVREGEGIAAGVLESLGVNLERVRSETMRLLQERGGGNEDEGPGDPAGQ